MLVQVECYAGYKADERPLCFYLGARRHQIEEVLDRWYGPHANYFRVLADDGNMYILSHTLNAPDDPWTLESFRRNTDPGRT